MPGESADGGELSRRVGDPYVIQQVFEQLHLLLAATQGPEHRIAAATKAYRAITARPNMTGMLYGDAFPETRGQQIEAILDRVYASGEPESLYEYRAQIDLPGAGGRGEFFMDFNVNPWRAADGTVIGTIIDGTDVTERVRERRARRRKTTEAERGLARVGDGITVLQRELLPAGVPVLPEVQLAASYLLADADTAAGGDWFDAFPLPDGRVALVVGDVVGHGVTASATMGQLRIVLHERLVASRDVGTALAALDTAAARIRGARAATVCVVLLDPATGVLTYCTAGHPPPLILSTAGESRYLPATGAGPIGVGAQLGAESVGTDRLADNALVLLYTDGILERPGRDLTRSTAELAQVAADIAADRALRDGTGSVVERVCGQTLELLTRATGHTDDITVLAGQRVPAPRELTLELAATSASLTPIRERLDEWLTGTRAGSDDGDALRHAVVELATNAVEHAYLDAPRVDSVTVSAALAATGEVRIQVADRGRWRDPVPSPDRGLGLQVTEALVDALQIEHDEWGTMATVRHRLSQPARLLTTESLSWTVTGLAPDRSRPLLMLDQPSAPSPRIRIDGPVDSTTAGEFARALRTAGATGTRSLTADLTAVTHLASAGISVLYQVIELHRASHTELRLYAPEGTTADLILSLVRLAHVTDDPDYPLRANG
ncbi:MAG TPA: SpoIIE family protein phosphatase [Pseudonocardiaceae bacterium]|nr:SpoIIE family protein phosphatase [Pseudonocardiaceae bacterium]